MATTTWEVAFMLTVPVVLLMGLKGLTHLLTPLQIHVNTGISYGTYTSATLGEVLCGLLPT